MTQTDGGTFSNLFFAFLPLLYFPLHCSRRPVRERDDSAAAYKTPMSNKAGAE